MYQAVCDAPQGNGFKVEHLPEMFATSNIDDCCDHVHSFYEILWFQEGTGYHTVDFVEYKVKPGTIFFISPGQLHHFDRREGYKGVTIKMCTDLLMYSTYNGHGINKMFLKYNTFHTYDSVPYYNINEETSRKLKMIVEEMDDESNRNTEFGNIDILKSLLCIFLVIVARYGTHDSEQNLETIKPSHLLFVQFRRMVEQEFTRMHTVQEYASKLNVASRTLHKSVNECSGKTPLALINGRIVLEAKRMIRYTNLMIKEIAYELGYEDTSYFVKLFKRETGYLPSDFRELDSVTRRHKTKTTD